MNWRVLIWNIPCPYLNCHNVLFYNAICSNFFSHAFLSIFHMPLSNILYKHLSICPPVCSAFFIPYLIPMPILQSCTTISPLLGVCGGYIYFLGHFPCTRKSISINDNGNSRQQMYALTAPMPSHI